MDGVDGKECFFFFHHRTLKVRKKMTKEMKRIRISKNNNPKPLSCIFHTTQNGRQGEPPLFSLSLSNLTSLYFLLLLFSPVSFFFWCLVVELNWNFVEQVTDRIGWVGIDSLRFSCPPLLFFSFFSLILMVIRSKVVVV